MVEIIIKWLGGLLAYAALAILLFSIWRGIHRLPGRTSGRTAGWLRSALFYFFTTSCFLILSIIYWKPISVSLSPTARWVSLCFGSLLYFPGMIFLLWARGTLGKMYFVSTSFSAQLYADHALVTTGPFAIVRHPMYLGLILTAFGSLLIYFTWTALGYAVFVPFVLLRARREEQALSEEFGGHWREYCKRVPPFLPRLRKQGVNVNSP